MSADIGTGQVAKESRNCATGPCSPCFGMFLYSYYLALFGAARAQSVMKLPQAERDPLRRLFSAPCLGNFRCNFP
jgi:hypothetical protein